MFDIGWTELLVIGVVALVVVGPKDLPVMFKTFGRFMARARAMAREFSRAMESAADETGIKDVAKDIKAATNPMSSGIDRLKEAADRFEKWEPARPAVQPKASSTAPAAVADPAAPAVAQAAAPAATATPAAAAQPLTDSTDPKAQA